jgi:MoaA/NifB/PqqE/SkfB family radical SAM enzyme
MFSPNPEFVRLDVTWRCNLNCKHCQTGMFRGPNHPEDLTTDQLVDLFGQLSVLGTRAVGLLGGEPTLRRDLPVLLRSMRSVGIQPTVTTNAVTVTEPLADLLMNETETTVTISLDGPEKESHEYLRGRGTFTKTIGGIRTFVTRRCGGSSAKVGISAVLNRSNIQRAEQFLDLAKELKVDHLTLSAVHRVGNAIRFWNDISLETGELMPVGERLAQRILSDTELPSVQVNFFTPAFREYLRWRGYGVPMVPLFDRSGLADCYIQCDGRVFPSQKCSEIDPNVLIGAARDIGIVFRNNSVRDHSFKDIWFGEDFKRYRKFVLAKNYVASYESCATCKFSRNVCLPTASAFLAGDKNPHAICVTAHAAMGHRARLSVVR